MTKKHIHDWMLSSGELPYRDQNGERFILDIYICECGSGSKIATPLELYKKGYKSMELVND